MKHLSWLIALTLASTAAFAKTEGKSCEAHLADDYGPVSTAAQRFRTFFHEIQNGLFEREFFLDISKLGLLANEHVLMLGPPGNAKSMGVDMIINNIVDEDTGETSVFKIQMTPETSLSETHGVIDYKKITEENVQTRMYEQGMLSARLVFIDEFFDARANAIRNNLMALNEREHAQGRERIKGITETAWAASNKYINEVYDKAGDEGPKAIIDRFAFVAYVPGEVETLDAAMRLVTEVRAPQPDKMTFQELNQLRAKVEQVEIPSYVAQMLSVMFMRMKDQTESLEESEKKRYLDQRKAGLTPLPPYRATKYFTPRTLRKAGKILRAIVVDDWIAKEGARPLRASTEDIGQLIKFFTMNSQSEDFLRRMEDSTVNPNEKVQIMSALKEREMFRDIYSEILGQVNEHATVLTELEYERENAITPNLKKELARKMTEEYLALAIHLTSSGSLRETGEKEIAANYILSTLRDWLRTDMGEEYERGLEGKLQAFVAELEKKAAAERRAEEERVRREEEARVAEERRLQRIEQERQDRIAAFAIVREKLTNNSPTRISQFSGQLQVFHSSMRAPNVLQLFSISNYRPRLTTVNLKTGRIIKETDYAQDASGHPRQVVQLETGDYLLWYGDKMRIWDTKKGRMGGEIKTDPQFNTQMSVNSVKGKVWFVGTDDNDEWQIAAPSVTKMDKVKWTKLSAFSFETSIPGQTPESLRNSFEEDQHRAGHLRISADGKMATMYIPSGYNDFPVTYEIDLAKKKIKLTDFIKVEDGRITTRTEFGIHIGPPDEKKLAIEILDDKVIFHGDEKFEQPLDDSIINLHEYQNNWDIAPDRSYGILSYNRSLYGYDYSSNETFNMNYVQSFNDGIVHFVDKDNVLVVSSYGYEVIRLPTADK